MLAKRKSQGLANDHISRKAELTWRLKEGSPERADVQSGSSQEEMVETVLKQQEKKTLLSRKVKLVCVNLRMRQINTREHATEYWRTHLH